MACLACRESFRELVLTDSGRVRWNRIENLVAESSKSVGYDRSQLWKVADWIFGDPGAGVRKPVAAELARLIDSAVAGPVLPESCINRLSDTLPAVSTHIRGPLHCEGDVLAASCIPECVLGNELAP